MGDSQFIALIPGRELKRVSWQDIDALLETPATASPRRPVDAYLTVPWVRRCVELRAGALASIPYEVVNARSGAPVSYPPLHAHLWQTEAWLCLAGAAYWLIRGTPRLPEFQILNPLTVRPIADETGLTAFEQTVGAITTRFALEEIIYFRTFNPTDDVGPGASPAAAALTAARLSQNAQSWAVTFFERAAIPPVILTTEGPLHQAERDEIRSAWDRISSGLKRAWRTAVLGGGVRPVVVGAPVRDVAMPQLMSNVRQQIAVAFGIPQTLLEDAANYATARQHWVSFWRETIIPQALLIAVALNHQLFAKRNLEFRWRVQEIEALQQEEAEKANSVVLLVQAGIMTVDEARRQMGLAETSPTGGTETAGRATAAIAVLSDLERWRRKYRRAQRQAGDGTGETGSEFKSTVIPSRLAEAVRVRMAEGDADPFSFIAHLRRGPEVRVAPDGRAEAELRQRIAGVLKRYLAAVLTAAEARTVVGDALAALNGMGDDLRAAIEPFIARLTADLILAQTVEVGLYPDIAVINRAAVEWASRYAYELIRGLTETTREVVQQAVTQFLTTPGMTIGDLRAMLEPTFGPVRAEMIAITETTRAANQATGIYQELVAEWGLEMVRVWHVSYTEGTGPEGGVCPICEENDGKSEPYWTVPGGPPAHPRCRCWTTLRVKR